LGLRDLVLVGFGVDTVLGVLAGDLVDLATGLGVFLAAALTGDLLLPMTCFSGESACPVVASAFGAAFPPELFLVAAFALTFLALANAFEACLARAMAPGAGVFLATSAHSRFFFTDIFGVFLGSATVALFLTDWTRALDGVARGRAGVLVGVLNGVLATALAFAVAGVLAFTVTGVLVSAVTTNL